MTRIDQIIQNALAGSPETHVAILAREVVRLRGAQFVVIPQDCGTCGSYQDIGGDPHKCSGCSGGSFPNWNKSRSLAHVHSIHADRVLGDGMVEVDALELGCLLDLCRAVRTPPKGCARILDVDWEVAREAKDRLDAIRANQGGVDHV